MKHSKTLYRLARLGLAIILLSTLSLAEVQQRSVTPRTPEDWQRLRNNRAAEALAPSQRTAVQSAINAIGNACDSLTYTDSTGTQVTIATSQIKSVLQDQLNDGRIRVDSSLASSDYAVCHQDGNTTTDGDQMDLHPDVASGNDSTFLQEVLVHEYLHKTQASSSRSADEVEAYSLELSYKDSVGVDSSNWHRTEAVTNLAHFQGELDSGSSSRSRRASNAVQRGAHIYQAVQYTDWEGNTFGILKHRPSGAGWDWELILGTPDFIPRDLMVIESDPTIPEAILLVTGFDIPGAIYAVRIDTITGEAFDWWPTYIDTDIRDFLCMSRDPLYPDFTYLLDKASNQIIRLIDTDGDMIPDSFFDVFFELPPELADTQRMDWEFHPIYGTGLLLDDWDKLYSTVSRLDEPMIFAQDTDGDMYLDSFFDVFLMDFVNLTPLLFSEPLPDDIVVEIYGSPHHPIEVWATTPEGDPLEPLGFGMLPWTQGPVELMRPLMPGEFIMPFDLFSGLWQGQPTMVGEPCIPDPPVVTIEYEYDGLNRLIRLDWEPVECGEWYRVTFSRAYGPENTILITEETEAEFDLDIDFDSNDGMLKVYTGNGMR